MILGKVLSQHSGGGGVGVYKFTTTKWAPTISGFPGPQRVFLCFTWMSQEVSKWLVNGLYHQYIPFISTRWWFQIFFIFTPIWGRFPI